MTDDDNMIKLPTKAYEQFVDSINAQPSNPTSRFKNYSLRHRRLVSVLTRAG